MTIVRLTDQALPFWVDVRISLVRGSWVAVADLADTPEIAASNRFDLAILFALWPLGEACARRLATSAMAQLEAR